LWGYSILSEFVSTWEMLHGQVTFLSLMLCAKPRKWVGIRIIFEFSLNLLMSLFFSSVWDASFAENLITVTIFFMQRFMLFSACKSKIQGILHHLLGLMVFADERFGKSEKLSKVISTISCKNLLKQLNFLFILIVCYD
jgi:hypothetical protein